MQHLPVHADDVAVVAKHHRRVPDDISMRLVTFQNRADNDLRYDT